MERAFEGVEEEIAGEVKDFLTKRLRGEEEPITVIDKEGKPQLDVNKLVTRITNIVQSAIDKLPPPGYVPPLKPVEPMPEYVPPRGGFKPIRPATETPKPTATPTQEAPTPPKTPPPPPTPTATAPTTTPAPQTPPPSPPHTPTSAASPKAQPPTQPMEEEEPEPAQAQTLTEAKDESKAEEAEPIEGEGEHREGP